METISMHSFHHPVDPKDPNYVIRLCTLLVASFQDSKDKMSRELYSIQEARSLVEHTIQEACSLALQSIQEACSRAERSIQEVNGVISQSEYIFCKQLYPNFQNELHPEAIKIAEAEWKEKEMKVLSQMDSLRLEKDNAIRSLEALQSEFDKGMKEKDHLILEQESKRMEAQKSHDKLLKLFESKSCLLADWEKQLKDHEEKASSLRAELTSLEGKCSVIEQELQVKKKEVSEGKELQQALRGEINSQANKIKFCGKMLTESEQEKKQLTDRIGKLEASLHDVKTNELKERSCLQEQIAQQLHLKGVELAKKDQQLLECQEEKKSLLSRLNELRHMNVTAPERSKHTDDLVREIELKEAELLHEKQQLIHLTKRYKNLLSQHNYVLSKYGLTKENMKSRNRMDVENGSFYIRDESLPDLTKGPTCRRPLAPIKAEACHNDTTSPPTTSASVAGEARKLKAETNYQDIPAGKESTRVIQAAGSDPPSTIVKPASSWKATRNMGTSSGTKRRLSDWRETRSRQSPGGVDPHDDFLDTPYENIRGNLNKGKTEETPVAAQAPASDNMDCDSSDDETQDINAVSGHKKQVAQGPKIGEKGYKYVEPVRKKAERETLKGVECKQCKKFYDAVLPDGRGKDADGNFRCEHHEGVSRHRYRYVPPSTPEGFWNIGFDSEN